MAKSASKSTSKVSRAVSIRQRRAAFKAWETRRANEAARARKARKQAKKTK